MSLNSPISNDCSSQQIFLQYRKWSLNFVRRKVSSIEQGEEMSLRNAAEVPQVWFVLESAIKFTAPAQKASAREGLRCIFLRGWSPNENGSLKRGSSRSIEQHHLFSFFSTFRKKNDRRVCRWILETRVHSILIVICSLVGTHDWKMSFLRARNSETLSKERL